MVLSRVLGIESIDCCNFALNQACKASAQSGVCVRPKKKDPVDSGSFSSDYLASPNFCYATNEALYY